MFEVGTCLELLGNLGRGCIVGVAFHRSDLPGTFPRQNFRSMLVSTAVLRCGPTAVSEPKLLLVLQELDSGIPQPCSYPGKPVFL